MKLHELGHILDIEMEAGSLINTETWITGISYRSQEVKEGYLFVAIKGHQKDGHQYITQAIENGACAVIGEEENLDIPVPYFCVGNSRRALSLVSDHYYNFPTHDKIIIGVTGTNGKTTTSSLLRNILEENGFSCALFGSTKNIINGVSYTTVNTTPTLLEINRLLAGSEDEVLIIEVSSHALTQHRVDGILFDYALFTNLSHDHLDYHGSMENYFSAKKKLFSMLKKNGKAIVNTDDYWGEILADELSAQGIPAITVGENKQSDVKLERYTFEPRKLLLKDREEIIPVKPFIYGYHNMYNIAMAYGTARQIGVDMEATIRSIEQFKGVEGRFTVIFTHRGSKVAIDYAHTPDALFHCLNTVREQCDGKLIHLFGFRGDRDSTKREEMISISSELSDQYILTFDDLNSVSSEVMKNTLVEIQEKYGYHNGRVIMDRTKAIEDAVASAREKDWIVITGKGLEKYQQKYQHPVQNDEEAVLFLGSE
ncbi:UDP-N-acetylmuramoyl-L-alanyl-D-glutamate--2,6-diaminopimelate ligase [Salimicrobium flavidum]|uniref:UDP-N-acetylmuramoylalanyl-D-glutamate--2,6-diaminopimelate ligase n=1 Tax=Salimicrobium flavidum TaxID=570947 RepID=A0A1N7KBK7_9BACI|nr:UDP-N-acetylmuramoyl-L-alanyl-D-glutamate--2,6-diaminopimelate ligase [Salimicrobium flavidum]SIS58987.1 UDP-N-acetylmuramoylalanyl-D-glutamate--2,6-diaminopimelate ligase [Salimicrobium flavidum]